MTKRNKHIGSSLDTFLSDEGISKRELISKSKEPEALKTAGAEEGIRQGLDDVAHGRTRPAREFFEEFEAKNGIPR
jgi:hypothetical protein